MTTYKGNSGVIKIGSNAIAEVTGWTLTETGGVAEDTQLGDTARTYLADGLPSWKVSLEAHWFPGDATGQALTVIGASLSLVLDELGTATGTPTHTGTGIVTDRQIGAVGNGVVIPFSCSLQGSGALTHGVN